MSLHWFLYASLPFKHIFIGASTKATNCFGILSAAVYCSFGFIFLLIQYFVYKSSPPQHACNNVQFVDLYTDYNINTIENNCFHKGRMQSEPDSQPWAVLGERRTWSRWKYCLCECDWSVIPWMKLLDWLSFPSCTNTHCLCIYVLKLTNFEPLHLP